MKAGRTLDLDSFQREAARLWGTIAPPRQAPMLHEIWVRACVQSLNPHGRFEIIRAGEAAQPTAAAAFARRARAIPRLFLLGAEELWEPTDVLYQDESAAADLARSVVEKGLPARFGHFPADSPFVTALKEACRGKAFVVADPVAGSPFIRLNENWREPESQFSKRRQGDFRRMRRKAEAIGAVTIDILAPGPENVDALLAEAMNVEAGGWKGRAGSALAFDDKARAFFQRYGRLASEAGILRLSFLRIDGKAAATQIAVECDDAFWLLKIGYDDAYKACSPGNLLLLETVRRAAEHGRSTFEFLGKSAPWTAVWTKEERANIRLRIYPYNIAGAGAFLVDGIAAAARRARAFVSSKMSKDHAKGA